MDLQNDFLDSAGLSPAREPLVAQAAALLQACRAKNIPVIHVWTTVHREDDRRLPHWKKSNRWLCVAGTPGHQTPLPLQPLAHETVVHKSGFNGFAGGSLDAALKQLHCDTLIIAGVHLHTCVRTAAAKQLRTRPPSLHVRGNRRQQRPRVRRRHPPLAHERDVEILQRPPKSTQPSPAILPNRSKLIHRSPRNTSTILFELPIATPADIAAATLRAQNAQAAWRLTEVSVRCQLLEKVATRLEAAAKDLGVQMALELGKPVAHGADEVRRAAENIRDVIRRATAFEFQKRSPAGTVRHEPATASSPSFHRGIVIPSRHPHRQARPRPRLRQHRRLEALPARRQNRRVPPASPARMRPARRCRAIVGWRSRHRATARRLR